MVLTLMTMPRIFSRFSLLLAVAVAPVAYAQDAVFRCENGHGVIEYRNNGDTKGCKKISIQAVVSVPSASPAPKASTSTTAPAPTSRPSTAARGDFPQVNSATQKARDNDRRAVLEQELQAEQQRLATLQSEYKNGQPDRNGNEKNYQKYLDRTEQLKGDINRSNANVEALQREIGNLK